VNFDAAEFVDTGGAGYDALWRMARKEHGRFNAERLADGWRYGPVRDLKTRTSPYSLPWDKLPPFVQEWDRAPFRKLHDFLQPLELMVVRIHRKETED
jgi:hypothetical protein